jgi:hypothetical protein
MTSRFRLVTYRTLYMFKGFYSYNTYMTTLVIKSLKKEVFFCYKMDNLINGLERVVIVYHRRSMPDRLKLNVAFDILMLYSWVLYFSEISDGHLR